MPLLFWHAYDALDISIELLMSLFPEQVFISESLHCNSLEQHWYICYHSREIIELDYWILRIYNHALLWYDRNTSIFKFMQIILCIKSGSWWLIETKNHISVVMNSCGKWLITECFMYTNFLWKWFDNFGLYELFVVGYLNTRIDNSSRVSFRFVNDKFSVCTIRNFPK